MSRSRIGAYLAHRHDPLTGLVLTLPVFLIYHIGILAIDRQNGVDLFTTLTLRLLRHSVMGYLAVTVGLAAILTGALVWLRRRGKVKPAALFPVAAESTAWAVVMLVTVGWAVQQLFAGQAGGAVGGPLDAVVLSAGAGFHEELVFRVALYGGSVAAIERWTNYRGLAAAFVPAIVTSVIFSAVHYIGPFADNFALVSFTFRFFLGLFFVALYRYRGFAVAVYSHFIYDILVLGFGA